jgi:hypothetical protein
LFVPLTDSTFPNNQPIHHINRFASLAALRELSLRQP